MDLSILLPWLKFGDLLALYQVNRYYQYWLNENLTCLANRFCLPTQKTFQKFLISKCYNPPLRSYQETDGARTIIETRVYDFFLQRIDLPLLVEIPELLANYGVSSRLQYRLCKKYYFVDAQALLKGLPFVSKLSTLKFFLSKLQRKEHAVQLKEALFELVHNAMHSAKYKILLYLLAMYPALNIQFCDKETENFLEKHVLKFSPWRNKDWIQLVVDQCSCTEIVAIHALNLKRGDVINAIMHLTVS